MALPGLELHLRKGDRKNNWAVRVSGDWRVTFEFYGSAAKDVDFKN